MQRCIRTRRKPETTALYRIGARCRDDLTRYWEEHFQHMYGALRHEVPAALDAYLNCGILAHGCVRACCERCNHSELIAFSCTQRCLYPSCDAKRAVVFAENLVEHVLKPYPHQHVVFTVPTRVRPLFKSNRSLLQPIYTAALASWKELLLEQCPAGRKTKYRKEISRETTGSFSGVPGDSPLSIAAEPGIQVVESDGSVSALLSSDPACE